MSTSTPRATTRPTARAAGLAAALAAVLSAGLLAGLLAAAPPAGAAARPAAAVTTSSSGALLRVGSRGPAVLAVQQRLSSLGYWLGTPSGRYDELTRQAVLALQGAAGLPRDGVLGPASRRALDAGRIPVVRTRHGHVTEVDRAAGLLVFADDGRVSTVLHTSTGSDARYTSPSGTREVADTPAGTFHVYRQEEGWHAGQLGRMYRPRYLDPRQGIAVHGYGSVPARPASHGCARVTPAAMDLVWARDLMPMGSTVVVR